MKENIIIGTRSSELALWQSNYIKTQLEEKFPGIKVELKHVKTKGDKIQDVALSKIGGKGLFTKELENELITGSIDIAAHSLKDLQTDIPEGLELTAVTKRHSPGDALVAREKGMTLAALPEGGTIATGSLRRKAQALITRPDLNVVDLRGNINTRIKKFLDSDWDAIILARAGVERINLERYISSYIGFDVILPAVGQGALGVEISEANHEVRDMLAKINDDKTAAETTAERALLKALGGGCQTPIAAFAEITGGKLVMEALVASVDGKEYIRRKIEALPSDPGKTGRELAGILLNNGADKILGEIGI